MLSRVYCSYIFFRPTYQSTNLSTPPATVITNDAYEMYHDDDILNTIQSTPWFDREYVKDNRSLVSYLGIDQPLVLCTSWMWWYQYNMHVRYRIPGILAGIKFSGWTHNYCCKSIRIWWLQILTTKPPNLIPLPTFPAAIQWVKKFKCRLQRFPVWKGSGISIIEIVDLFSMNYYNWYIAGNSVICMNEIFCYIYGDAMWRYQYHIIILSIKISVQLECEFFPAQQVTVEGGRGLYSGIQ